MVFQLKKSTRPVALRSLYLDSLAEPQELFLESLVTNGTTLIYGDSAYAVIAGDTLVEIYATPDSTGSLVELFQQVVAEQAIKKVLCKSYDTQLLYAAFSSEAKVKTQAYLFRRVVDVPHAFTGDVVVFRAGSQVDIDSVMSINDNFFENVDEVVSYLECDGLFVIEIGAEIVGCGIGKIVVPGRDDVDIGMLVAQKHRNKGLGQYVVGCLKDHYLQLGLRPICGCAASNHASKRTLEKAGFVSEHRLLSISY